MPGLSARASGTRYVSIVVSVVALTASASQSGAQFSSWGFAPASQPQQVTRQWPAPEQNLSGLTEIPAYEVAGLPCRGVGATGTNYAVPSGCNTNYPAYSMGEYPGGACDGPGYASSVGQSGYGCDFAGVSVASPTRWLGSVGALTLDREGENHRFFSYNSANEAFQLLDSRDSNFDFTTGVEAHLLHWNTCTNRGTEAVYWGIFPDEGLAHAYPSQVTGNLNGIFNFDQLDYNGNLANLYVDNALVHRLRRNTEIHNFELNQIWALCCAGASSSCWSFGGLAGFRYLRFEDALEFASDTIDTTFTGAVEELYYNMDVENDLFGVQFGALADRRLGCSRWSLTFGAKAGVFVNSADARSTIGGAAGTATINNGPNLGAAWDVSASKEDLATIAEVQAGLAYRFGHHWRVRSDYRVIGVSGVALPTHQIYQDLRGIQDVRLLATGGDLILHGFFVGAERNY